MRYFLLSPKAIKVFNVSCFIFLLIKSIIQYFNLFVFHFSHLQNFHFPDFNIFIIFKVFNLIYGAM